MADLAGAVAALEALASDDVVVRTDGAKVHVAVFYRDSTGLSGGAGRQRSAFEFEVVFTSDTGEYVIRTIERSAVQGHDSEGIFGGFSTTKTWGTSRVTQWESGTSMRDGQYDDAFSSTAWKDAIVQRVQAHGWSARTGFWRGLFG